MAVNYRKERLDRGIKARSDDIFALASLKDLAYLTLPRLLLIGGLLLVPLLGGLIGEYWLKVILITSVIALLAMSWDLLSSVGLVSLGHSLFFGIGSYIAGSLSYYFGWTPLLSIPVAVFAGSLLSTILLYPILRLRGIYFALITLALPLLMMRVIEATKILGGTEGLSSLAPLPKMPLVLYLIVIAVLVCLFGFRRLIDSDYGLVLQAIKDNDRAVMAGGINIYWVRAQAVFIAALPATFASYRPPSFYELPGLSGW
jgi:branched-chain amino acid transport system permease protein